jgi:lysophospholipase L1-like esterase
VVEGVNYVSDSDTPSRQLENVLTNTEVLNFGISGYFTLAEVELLETRGLAFDPDEVIVVFTGNDFQNVVPEHTVASGVENRPRWAKKFFVRSAVFRLACLKLNWFAFGEEQDPVEGNRLAIGENNVVDAFERLRVAANKHEFQVTIAIWPSFTAEKIEDFENERRIRLLVERLADMHGLPSLRLGRAFRSHYDEVAPTQNPVTFYTVHADGMHPNQTAAKVAAQALKNYLNSGRGSEPPYTLGKVDVRAMEEARIRGGQDDVPEDMTFEQRTFLSLRYQGRAEDSEN